MVLPFQVAIFSGVSVAALMASAGDAYAVGGNSPEFVADFAGTLNSGTEYYRSGGSDTTFSSVFTHSGLVLPATMTDSDGDLKWAPHNLQVYSEAFDNAAWGKQQVSISANATTAPDGTSTADQMIEDNSSLQKRVTDTVSINTSGTYTFSVYVKQGTGSTRYPIIGTTGGSGDYYAVGFNLSTVAATQTHSASATGTSSITDIGSGWFKIEIVVSNMGFASQQFLIGLSNASTYADNSRGFPNYTGDNTSNMYFWGAHVYRSDLGGMANNHDRGDSYVPTTTAAKFLPRRNHYLYNGSTYDNAGILIESAAATNLLTYVDFTDAAWSKANSIVTNDSVGPDGVSNSASTLNDNSAGGASLVSVNEAVTVSTSTAYTFSVYAKQDQLIYVGLGTTGLTTPADAASYFNLSTGAVNSTATGHTPRIENVGSGWYRCSITFTTDASDTTGNVVIYLSQTGTNATVDRDGTSSVLIYGPQFEVGSVPTSYIPTSGSTVTRAAETLTVAGSSLPYSTSAMSFNWKGKVSYADNGGVFGLWYSRLDAANRLSETGYTNGSRTGLLALEGRRTSSSNTEVVSSDTYVTPGINVALNTSSRITTAIAQLAEGGTLIGTDNATSIPDLSAQTFYIGKAFDDAIGAWGDSKASIKISLFRMWGVDIGQSGIETAST